MKQKYLDSVLHKNRDKLGLITLINKLKRATFHRMNTLCLVNIKYLCGPTFFCFNYQENNWAL